MLPPVFHRCEEEGHLSLGCLIWQVPTRGVVDENKYVSQGVGKLFDRQHKWLYGGEKCSALPLSTLPPSLYTPSFPMARARSAAVA